MWTNVFKFLINIALVLLRHKSEQKQVNEEVYQEIKETPEPNKVEPLPLIQEPINQPKQMKEFKIIQKLLPPSQYVQDSKFRPEMIILHHTAGASFDSSYRYWASTRERIATHFGIDRNGDTYQCIPLERAFGFHIYIASPGNKIDRKFKNLGQEYDRKSIGIELASYGWVEKYGDKFLNCYGKVIDPNKVIKLDKPYKGFEYWEAYTQEQLDSLENLLTYLLAQFPKIASNLKDDYSNIFSIDQDALNFVPGIYSHTSLRQDKYDCFPDPNLIKMLNNLKNKI